MFFMILPLLVCATVVLLEWPKMAKGTMMDCLFVVFFRKSVARNPRNCANECGAVGAGLSVQVFADRYIAQVALLGIQLILSLLREYCVIV